MQKYCELAAIVGPLALFRSPITEWNNHLWIVTPNMTLEKTPWTEVPTESQVADYLGILPWDDMPLPILSYIDKMQ